MAASPEEIAAAFSSHRFTDAFPYLADAVRWVLVGGPVLEGRSAVMQACASTTAELATVTTEVGRFLLIAGDRGVAVDVLADFTAPDGSTSRVSSCDLYVFDHGLISEIMSYTVELPSDDRTRGTPGRPSRRRTVVESAVDEQPPDRSEQPLGAAGHRRQPGDPGRSSPAGAASESVSAWAFHRVSMTARGSPSTSATGSPRCSAHSCTRVCRVRSAVRRVEGGTVAQRGEPPPVVPADRPLETVAHDLVDPVEAGQRDHARTAPVRVASPWVPSAGRGPLLTEASCRTAVTGAHPASHRPVGGWSHPPDAVREDFTVHVVTLPANCPPDRFYRGGRRITDFRGVAPGGDHEPEDWVASTTAVFGLTRPGRTTLPDGVDLDRAVHADPVGWLGDAHVHRFGADTRLLVKLLDAGQRLPVHAHPDGAFAGAHLGRPHGKAEAWFILTPGVVHLGLTAAVPPDQLRRLVDTQDIETMLGLLHRVPVTPGDVVYVPPGVLHAIGEGVFIVEVQEPEDLSILLDWRDFDLDGTRDGHLGLGFDLALQAVEHRARSTAELAELVRPAGFGPSVLPAASRPYFRLERAAVDGRFATDPGFAVLVTLAGSVGLTGGPELPAGTTAVAPHAAGPLVLTGEGEVLICRPPDAG
ncbi:nuclear transport factor 2 family protein [Nakamurella deserti]|uniref:nuclear transport factor 2 family protein n=1 Tax=Nakamurella deserti TaxID=2164074 RepID=UPI00197CB02F|nr:nuclear transport factor 2 family protein [Nakamurella deserti]